MAKILAATPLADEIPMDSTAEDVTAVTFPVSWRVAYLTWVNANGRIAYVGTDSEAVGADFTPVLPNAEYRLELSNGRARNLDGVTVYLASDVISSIVKVRGDRG